jgi:hypothetical protein
MNLFSLSNRRPRLKRAFLAVLATGGLVLGTALPAQATYYSGGFGTGLPNINNYSYNTTYQPAMNLAVANWNATPTPADIQKIGGGNVVAAGANSASWYGYYTCYSTSFRIDLNATKISSSCSNASNCITAVLVHEFGHAFYNADQPPVCSSCSIMRADRDRNSTIMRSPRTYDINETNNYL